MKDFESKLNRLEEINSRINSSDIDIEEAMKIFKEQGMEAKVKLLKFRKEKTINVYTCGWLKNYFYGYMVPSTGYLNKFDLKLYKQGVIIRFPNIKNPDQIPEFEEHKKALSITTLNQIFPEWSSEINTLITNCSASSENANSTHQCFLDFVHHMQSSYTSYVIDAVYSMAHALNILFENTTVKDIDCELKLTMDINAMKSLLSRVSFVGLTGNVSFDKDGDRQSVLYDIVNFQQVVVGHTKRLEEVVVGKWKENEPRAKRLHFSQNILWNSPANQPPKSECLDQCPAGTRKSITSPCCWNCVACPRGTVNPIPGLETCSECLRGKR